MPRRIYYGSETAKAMRNFGRGSLPSDLIRAYGEVKKSCILAIQEFNKPFDKEIFNCIIGAIDEVISGKLDSQFPLPLRQGGAGTSINMNINEVIAGRASELAGLVENSKAKIDPITDINRYQSTNDTFPTAVTVMLYRHLAEIEDAVIRFQETLVKKENEEGMLVLTGRTEMQDALPVTMGQVFASWAGAVERDRWRLHKLKERIRTIPLGGTAIGTCFSAPAGYIFLAEKYLRDITGLPLGRSQNLTDEIANNDKLSELASGYSIFSQNIFKITGDLLIYTSSMTGEISHPDLQYGSTIMAAKTNPVILEYSRGLAVSVHHEAQKIMEYSRNGQLQLNAYLPFIADSFIEIRESLLFMTSSLIEKFFRLMKFNPGRMEENLIRSSVMLNALVPELGYYRVKELYNFLSGYKIESFPQYKKLILEFTGLEKDKIDELFDPVHSAGPCKN